MELQRGLGAMTACRLSRGPVRRLQVQVRAGEPRVVTLDNAIFAPVTRGVVDGRPVLSGGIYDDAGPPVPTDATESSLTILITGGAGFIGRHLTEALLAGGHHVRVLDALTAQIHGETPQIPAELSGAELLRGDVRDSDCLEKALAGVDAVAHLAAETGVGQSMYEVERYVDVNDRGTASLLQAMAKRDPPPRLVLASSRAVYGEGLYRCQGCGEVSPPPRSAAALRRGAWNPPCPRCGEEIAAIPTHEGAPPSSGSVYAATKLAQEHLCQIVGAAYEMPTIILRFFNVYGPGQSLSN